ncbi:MULTISPECIES: hypothetical protein [Helicobacter]|uniref:HdrB-like C-terminal domain-containing protein n=1 Tax=Helicobacter typhlonius TaxID=76936 RepID=A0A099UDW3_9HELI|nr:MULTISPECIES: hypothetical protein [Helicobacter]TLD77974.1 hypothetical protein LS75_008345 [Helicobacter typhlonius]TLD87945.1 hypothetical protein LS67_005775 [Helicobacter sp. MIT 03-1616]CUU39956.1 FIG00711102: Hypothetical protein [Helicobacter typhlonius]HCD73259.1 hypothetical protein [Helicobacter sp.]
MKYIIYDKYDSALNPQGLLSTTKALFAALNLEVISPASLQAQGLFDCGGYWARLAQKNDLLRNVAYNLALANAADATLVFVEEDAYANAFYAKSFIESHSHIMREIETQYLHQFNLLYDSKVQMCYLPDLLNSIDISPLIQKRFTQFLTAIVRGGYQAYVPKSTNHRIYNQVGLKVLETPLANQYYAHLLQVNPQVAYANSARLFFDLADLGVDFILSYSLSQFAMLDSNRAKICKACNRDNIAIPVLLLPQILLLALGQEDRNTLGFTYHKQKVEMF